MVRIALVAPAVVFAAVGAVLVWATVTEPAFLAGEALRRHPAAQAVADLEKHFFARFNVAPAQRRLELRDPALSVRVLEVPGEGPAILMVHGGGGMAAQWAPLAAELRGRHLFMVDRPGCGLTDGFDYGGVDMRKHAVSFIDGVLDGLGLKSAVLVGNSMGGLWSLWYSAERPDRVEGIALLGNPALFLGTSAPTPMRLMSIPGVGQAMMRLQSSDVPGTRTMLTRVMGKNAVDRADPLFLEVASQASQIPGTRRSFRTLIQSVLTPAGAKQRYAYTAEELKRVRAPMLLVYGDQDVYGNAIEEARATRPDMVIETFPGGHLPWFDDTARTGATMRKFLGDRLASTR